MWQPDPSWQPLPTGRSSAGCWRALHLGRPAVVKRLTRPLPGDSPLLSRPTHAAYWRREADFALSESHTAGLIPPEVLRVDEDEDGISIWWAHVDRTDLDDLAVVRALAAFAMTSAGPSPWSCRELLADRLISAGHSNSWAVLERTPWADVADNLWNRRTTYLARLSDGPTGPVHGDVVPANLLALRGADVITIDWAAFGWGPIGIDLGYFALSSRLPFDDLMIAFLGVAPEFDPTPVMTAARTIAVYTVFSRAAWALSRVAPGEGPLGAKLGHPSVAPHVRAVQRLLPQVEALIAG